MGFVATRIGRRLITPLLPKPGEGPDAKTREEGYFKVRLHGENGDNRLTVEVTGDRDPGYGSTAKMIAEAAVCLAKDELPSEGGVLTPAFCMGDALIARLTRSAGLQFTEVA